MYENIFRLSKSMVQEYSMRMWISRTGVKIYLGFLVLLFIAGVASFVLDVNGGIARWFAILFLPLYLLATYGMIRSGASRLCRQTEEKHKGQVPETLYRFENDGLVWVTPDGTSRQIPYTSFTRIVESKNLYILIFQGNQGLYLRKDGFTKGDGRQFGDFIRGKIRRKSHE